MCAPSIDADYLYLKINKKSKEKIRQPKETIMPIKVLIKRRFKDGYVNEINKVIKEIRFGAMDQEGYITAETMWDHEDPFRVVIVSNWRSIDYWKKWKQSDLRKSIEQKLEKFLDGQTEYEIFDLGVNTPLEKLKNRT
jgi:quinol monooxygenase YgiN